MLMRLMNACRAFRMAGLKTMFVKFVTVRAVAPHCGWCLLHAVCPPGLMMLNFIYTLFLELCSCGQLAN